MISANRSQIPETEARTLSCGGRPPRCLRTRAVREDGACARRPLLLGEIVALWGARRPDQLAPVKEVMGWTLDGSAMREIDRILAETIKDEVGAEFMAPQS